MKVEKERLLDLFDALGVDTARSAGWPASKLQEKVNADQGIARYREPGQAIDDADLSALYDSLAAAHMNHDLITVEDAPEVTTNTNAPEITPRVPVAPPAAPATPKTKPKPKGASPVKEKPAPSSWSDKIKYWKKNPKKISDRGPGVLRTIVDELKVAGKGKTPKGVTKEFILGVLKKKFTDRTEEKMRTTLNNMLPTGLRDEYGYEVFSEKTQSGVLGYYVKGDPVHAGNGKPAAAAKAAPAKPKAKPPAKKAKAKAGK